jgi:hypothetical protein
MHNAVTFAIHAVSYIRDIRCYVAGDVLQPPPVVSVSDAITPATNHLSISVGGRVGGRSGKQRGHR